MALYEHVFMARQDISQSQVEGLIKEYADVITEGGGKVGKVEYWGVKNLAYKIKKNRKAHYALMNLEAPPAAVAEMERRMGLSTDVIRFMTIKVEAHEVEPSIQMRKVDRDAVKEARASVLPDKELELQVHNRAEVEAATFPKGNAYVFVPKGKSVLPPILLELLKKRRDLCLIAKTNLRKADHLVMVDVELNDQLVIREMMWPEDMKHFPQVETEKIDKKNLTMAETLLEASVEPFDPKEYAKDSRARVAEIVDAAAGGATSPTKKAAKKKDTTQQDLSALLEAAIAAKKAS